MGGYYISVIMHQWLDELSSFVGMVSQFTWATLYFNN